jgi:predicted ATP-dependent endonuclease of OLD family
MLMQFRDEWLAGASSVATDGGKSDDDEPVPLHLVLVEEPEAHLHAQVQQVFINKAYTLLRNHAKLSGSNNLSTQLVVSTHSSHIAHEVDFETLRYFRRHQASTLTHSATTTVANLSHIFGEGADTAKFVKRYLKATHCDLFFADAAIFVEGSAERLLVPYFIRHHFPGLWRRYTSLIDIGGAHAHRFESLVRGLGLTVLVISDLDAAKPTETTNEAGEKFEGVQSLWGADYAAVFAAWELFSP